ncbi:MAG TPA: LytTR family DNA-binding domain-containing protein [Allosphingosinicella sp.]|nr:LytTR family DNA-binding domain-containing protein [Allosphingosinicella sp.]
MIGRSLSARRDGARFEPGLPVPGDRSAILLVWLASLFLALFVEPNYQRAAAPELIYYSVYNVAVGALVGFRLFDRLARRSLVRFAALAVATIGAGTLVNEGFVEASLFRTGPINFEGVYYGLLEAATTATLFLLLRLFRSLRGPAGDATETVALAAKPAESGDFFVRIGSETRRIRVADVLYLKAERDYAHIVCAGGRYFVSESLKDLLEKSGPLGVVRVHKSFAVNLRRVDRLTATEAGFGDEFVPVGRRYRQAVAEAWRRGRPAPVERASIQSGARVSAVASS